MKHIFNCGTLFSYFFNTFNFFFCRSPNGTIRNILGMKHIIHFGSLFSYFKPL